jgi:hypothetical protein
MPESAKRSHDRSASPAAPMSREVAEAILRRHGLDAAGLRPDELKRRWQELARRHHPDAGGDLRAMQEINAAYSILKPQVYGGARDMTSPRVGGLPVWAWAGHRGTTTPEELVLRQDYSDRNFLKKRLWELSGRSMEEWALWAFDGRELLPPVVSYGSHAILPEMAKAMFHHGRRGFRWPRAVLAQAPDEPWEALLLHADGRPCEPPLALPLSVPGDLARDRLFVAELPDRLDALLGSRRRF